MNENGDPDATPGWYKHPRMVNTVAFWDGQQFTDETRPEIQQVTFRAENLLWIVLLLVIIGVAIGVLSALGDF